MTQLDRRTPRLFATVVTVASAVFAVALAASESSKDANGPSTASDAPRFDVPDASPSELLAFIRKTKARFVEGNSRDERVAFTVRQQKAICAAADKIRTLGSQPDVEAAAVSEKFAALWNLIKLNDPRAGAEAVCMAKGLENDPRKELADRARFFLLWERAWRVTDAPGQSPEGEAAALVDDIGRQLEGGNHDELLVMLASMLPEKLQPSQPQLAVRGAQRFALALSKFSAEPAKRAAKHLRDVARRRSIVGETVEICGHVFAGGAVDASKFRGQVVLVEYWATWCAPCIAEIPGIRSVYEKYHDRGFEVLAVSLDEDRDQLAKFLGENQVPWTVLCGRSADDSGMRQPMVVTYAIDTAGRNFLVDRQGQIVALDVRQDRLRELLERLLAETPRAIERND